MEDCTLCPRECHADRRNGKYGYCGQAAGVRAARAALHYWEEPCISGKAGSGAVFFSGCVLRCVYCQNREIARDRADSDSHACGKEISGKRLAEIFLELQEKRANNINLVTPTHFVPQIAEAVRRARDQGLTIPVVYNTGSYEKVDTLKSLDGLVDIYLPDLKYVSRELSKRYSDAPDYFERASEAIAEMVRQIGEPVFGPEEEGSGNGRPTASGEEASGLMKRGVIVRHLVLPGAAADSRKAVRYLYETYGNRIYISIMNQYTPMGLPDYPELNRRVGRREYEKVVDYALALGVENGFIQEGGTAKESFIPAFDRKGL